MLLHSCALRRASTVFPGLLEASPALSEWCPGFDRQIGITLDQHQDLMLEV